MELVIKVGKSFNWKGQPLVSYETIIKLISATKTNKGLTVTARKDDLQYEKGVKFTDADLENLQLKLHDLYPKWNYSVFPRKELT